MHAGKLVFSQVMEFFPWRRFDTCVRRYQGDYKIKTFPCSEQLRVMAFAQLTYRESLRDIEICLRAVKTKRYHMGIRSGVSRNNLSNANQTRDWRIYADFAQVLIGQARSLYAEEELRIDLQATVYALDASTIDLCLSMFPWAKFRKAKGAVKIHTLLNLQGSISEFILISDGKLHDVNALDYLIPMPGAYYVIDRGYLDFGRLYQLHQAKAYFVTRAKKNFAFKRRYSHEVDKTTGVTVRPNSPLENLLSLSAISRTLAADSLLRRFSQQTPGVSDQRFRFTRYHHRSVVQVSLANRIVFQMDQTTSANQDFLQHQPECRESTNLDCSLRLSACGHHQEATRDRPDALHNSTDAECLDFRENTATGAVFANRLQ